MVKILAVCEAFRYTSSHKRWELLAELNKNIDVTLIAPDTYIDTTWHPVVKTFKTQPIDKENFRVLPIRMKKRKFIRGGWLSFELFRILKRIKPDFIYLIGFETNNVIYEIDLIRKWFLPKTKIASFTMRGMDLPLQKKRFKRRWKLSTKIFDAIFCHYPHGMKVIQEQGNYNKPLFMQTQVGVDEDVFKPNLKAREAIREKYNLNDYFVFGTACRMESSKGIFDIIEALPLENDNWKLLMLGDGIEMKQFKAIISEKKLEERVILTGFVSQGEAVSDHMNAMDCFIHFPKTTPTWIDTFPLAVVQAMAVGLPVIGSDSGAVPYQLGNLGKIIPEGDVQLLNKEIQLAMENKAGMKNMGEQLRNRVLKTFEIKHLTKCFKISMMNIINEQYPSNQIDQTNFTF
ncbi:MAG: glycosyltransferase family 4 protein [Bacteroidales bacterium]|nr:glycosyltransferase family 4 protein [Bacteroidales bacterium]